MTYFVPKHPKNNKITIDNFKLKKSITKETGVQYAPDHVLPPNDAPASLV